MAGFSFMFLYNSARLVLQIYLIKSLREKEEMKNMRIVPMMNNDLDKTHVMTVKEAKTNHDEGNFFYTVKKLEQNF